MAKRHIHLTVDSDIVTGILKLKRKIPKVSISAVVNRFLAQYLQEKGVLKNKGADK